MELLDTALDDIEGLIEAYRATADEQRQSTLRAKPKQLRTVRRELAAAADTYAVVIMGSHVGAVGRKRIERARKHAERHMKAALARRSELAALVKQKRAPLGAARDDIRELLLLSLRCRAGAEAFSYSPQFDMTAAAPHANKLLIEVHDATLHYLARARDAAVPEAARITTAEMLLKAAPHAAELARLEADGARRSGIDQSVLTNGVSAPLNKLASHWAEPHSAGAAVTG